MVNLMSWFQSLVEGTSWYVFLSIWLLITSVVLAMFYRPRPRHPSPRTKLGFETRGRLFEASVDDEPGLPSYLTEKRAALRRAGNPVPVLLANDAEGSRPFKGSVVDRSTTGIRLRVPKKIQPGCILRVVAENAPETTPWVYIQVCRAFQSEDGKWEIGCRFSQTPPWSILLLFG